MHSNCFWGNYLGMAAQRCSYHNYTSSAVYLSMSVSAIYHKTPSTEVAHHRLIRPQCVVVVICLGSPDDVLPFQPEPVTDPLSSVRQFFYCPSGGLSPRLLLSLRSFVVELATKPLHPASTGRTFTFQTGLYTLVNASCLHHCHVCRTLELLSLPLQVTRLPLW